MPITGKLLADFTSFYDAVTKAEVELKGFETGANKVATSLGKMADSFSGRKIIQEATIAVEALKGVIGPTQLTEKEQARLNALLTEAIEKYKVLGEEAPKDMLALEKATRKIPPPAVPTVPVPAAGGLSLGALAAPLAATFSVTAIAAFGKSVLDTADHVQKLADKLGITTDEVQKLDYIAGQSGNDLDQMSNAMSYLEDAVGSESSGLLGVLKQIGVTFEDFKTQTPYEQMQTLAEGIAGIEDPAKRAAAATDALGKVGREVLPSLIADWDQLGSQAPRMSDQAIKGLDAIGDAWTRMKSIAGEVVGNFIGDLTKATEHPFFSAETVTKIESHTKAVGLSFKGLTSDLDDLLAKGKEWFLFVDQLGMKGVEVKPPAAPKLPQPPALYTPEAKDRDIKAIEDIGEKWEQARKKAAEAHSAMIAGLQADMFGENAKKGAAAYVEALGSIRNLEKLSSEEKKKINASMSEAIDVYKRFGQTAPAAMNELYSRTVEMPPAIEGISASMGQVGKQFDLVIPKIYEMPKAIDGIDSAMENWLRGSRVGIPEIPKQTKLVKIGLDEVAASLTQLAQVSGSSIAGVVTGLATITTAASTAKTSIASIKAAKTEGFSLSGIADMASGIMGIASAAIQAGVAIKNMFFGTKGRDAVKEFAATFQEFNLDTMKFAPGGGFEELHQKLQTLGAQGEKLWVALTQGVGRNNPEQAKAVIDLINKALGEQMTLQAGAATAATATGDAQSAAAQKALDAIKGMNDQIKGLQDSIAGEAPEEFMGAVETQVRAEIEALTRQRDEAQAAIGDVTDALGDQQQAQDETKVSSEAQTQATVDGATKVATALQDEVGAKLTDNQAAWTAWGDAVTAQIDRVLAKLSALQMPVLDGATLAQPSAGTGSYQTDVYLDGERIARSTAKRLPSVLRGVGVS